MHYLLMLINIRDNVYHKDNKTIGISFCKRCQFYSMVNPIEYSVL